MTLQQQRLTESRVMDGRARRVLHDDILPQVHAAMLALSTRSGAAGDDGANVDTPTRDAVKTLAEVHRGISDLLREMPSAVAPNVARLGLVGSLRQCVQEEFRNSFEHIEWSVDDATEERAKALSSLAAEVGFYAVREALRNAARHGRGDTSTRPLHVRLTLTATHELCITVEDNGVGGTRREYSQDASTNGGSGQGLIMHSTMTAVVGGRLSMENVLPHGTRVLLSLPLRDVGASGLAQEG
jgi:signal transduction histidine kinase